MTTAPPTAPQRPRVPRRALDGVLLLDKPVGLSSNDALIRAKRLYQAKKAGHTGTLDPLASGLLPLCFGEATKFSQDLLDADKTYEATMRLGITTSTGDAEGEVLQTREVRCSEAGIAAALARFLGEIVQIPPMYSALKRDGKPLYEYARAGQTVEREGRRITIHTLELLACALPDVTFRVTCSKGTYVRTLAEDIGEALGCGAHLIALRRTGVGALTLEHAVTLDALSDAAQSDLDRWLQPVDALLSTFPMVRLDDEAARRFLHGQRLRLADLSIDDAALCAPRVRVYAALDGGRLLGVAKASDGVLAPERLVVTATS
ncbi:tRNA pseudouridine(55) synthase TruB [Paraburkholderia solisilvae]|uniref:tRNA pseudouridine synthase B n=1 Tax=Paraburkholderia solisilvae TaxID=624376 RepID=A0A6J5F0E7_9BURK|nr:tRNA pseudouridine(55) synthase TruB [Paraburkholderia solisilvae]CAB3772299.1 tRNA pseudouridine synthase B [Paraburkholderia solisilvae]